MSVGPKYWHLLTAKENVGRSASASPYLQDDPSIAQLAEEVDCYEEKSYKRKNFQRRVYDFMSEDEVGLHGY